MKMEWILAVVSAVLLTGFLLIRPLIGAIGSPKGPNTKGHAIKALPPGVSTPASVLGSTLTGGGPTHMPTDADASAAGITHLEEVERFVVELTNVERQKAGVRPLTVDDSLRRSAREHSDDMIYRSFFDHVDPDGLDPGSRIAITHRRLINRMIGENISSISGNDGSDARKVADDIMYSPKTGWMNSPGHKENIVKPDYTHIGVGVSIQGKEIRATQNFAQTVALTDYPIPSQVASSENINLAATTASGQKAEKYDLWMSERGLKAIDARSIFDGKLNVPAGVYKLRFYFLDGKTYQGPQIEVR